MNGNTRQNGFSLMETLLAVGTLAIGLTFIAGTFLTGIYFSTLSTERTIAAVAAEEAFAKIRLYDLDPNTIDDVVRLYNLDPGRADPNFRPYVPYESLNGLAPTEFLYPSTADTPANQYSWAAICKRLNALPNGGTGNPDRLVQVTVFVSRKVGPDARFPMQDKLAWSSTPSPIPRPVHLRLETDTDELDPRALQPDELIIGDPEWHFITDGCIIVDDRGGQTYRVLERYADQPDRIRLDRVWEGGIFNGTERWIWVVPPPITGGRNPLVAVYQKVFRF